MLSCAGSLSLPSASSERTRHPPTEPRQRSLRRRSGKRRGRQAGQKGSTLRQRDDPDVVRNHIAGEIRFAPALSTQPDSMNVGLRQYI